MPFSNHSAKLLVALASILAVILSCISVYGYAYWKVSEDVKADARHILNFTEHKIDDAITHAKELDSLNITECSVRGQKLLSDFLYRHLNGGLYLIRPTNGTPWHYCSLVGNINFDVSPDVEHHYVPLSNIPLPSKHKMILVMAKYQQQGHQERSLFLAYFGNNKISTVQLPKAENDSLFEPSTMDYRHIELRLNNDDLIFMAGHISSKHTESIITRSNKYPIYVRSTLDMRKVFGTFVRISVLFLPMLAMFFILCYICLDKVIFKTHLGVDFQLYRAIKNKELKAFYQPIIDVHSQQVVGAEALLRWVKEDGTIENPGRFIKDLEQSKLITQVTLDILKQAPEDLAQIFKQVNNFRCSINLVPEHLQSYEFTEQLELLAKQGFPCHQLALEITERLPLLDLHTAQNAIDRIRALGVCIELDDAGTGYGGASYLQELNIDVMKIDKLFIDNLSEFPDKSQVLDAYLHMARTLNLEIIAEGVETLQQSNILLSKGVRFQQGYLFAKPLPTEEFLAFWYRYQNRNHCHYIEGSDYSPTSFGERLRRNG